MAFNLNFKDFNDLAFAALRSPANEFEKSRVADRLRTCFADRVFSRPSHTDSLELRRNLARLINALYVNGRRVEIPAAVAQALNVDKTASGFKLQRDGSLLATDHPLTDRRLVAIMTAINLNRGGLGAVCQALDERVPALFAGEHSAGFEQFSAFARKTFESLTATVRLAGDRAVKPATLKKFLPSLEARLGLLQDCFEGQQSQFTPAERDAVREAVTLALELGKVFGAQVRQLPPPPVDVEVPPVIANPEPQVLEALIEEGPKLPSPEELLAHREQLVRLQLADRLCDSARNLGINIPELVAFSAADRELFSQTGEAVDRRVREKVEALAAAIDRIVHAELEDAEKIAFLREAVPADGAIDEPALEAAVKACRTAKYEKIAEEKRATFEADVAREVLAKILPDEDCQTGLANLKTDFPMMKCFSKRVKKHHPGRELECFDLGGDGVLLKMLGGKLTAAKQVFDHVDITQDLAAFRNTLAAAVQTAADEMAARLKSVLSAAMFEDDRTLLVEMAIDPAQAEAFTQALAEAKKKYDDNVYARMVQVLMGDKVAAAQLKPLAHEAPIKVSTAFREFHGFVKPTKVINPRKVKKAVGPAHDDFAVDLGGARAEYGEKLRLSIRNLFADFFTAKAKDADAVRQLLSDNADAVQAMLLDPALIDTTAVPGDQQGGGDALRALFRELLTAIGEGVNFGQLTPKDFKKALATELRTKAVETFAAGLNAAGTKVLAGLQARLTQSLTNVLKDLTKSTGELQIVDKTLAELGASGIGSFDAGYGQFLANVLDHYFTDTTLADDHNRMLESLFRYGKTGGTVGDALSALIKGAGPIFQKVLQSIPLEGLPTEIVKALTDVKSALAPIPPKVIRDRLDAAIVANNKDAKRQHIDSIDIVRSLGAASVGQAVLCDVHLAGGAVEHVVVKFLRPGIFEIADRERGFFRKMAGQVGPAMAATFESRMTGIMQELDFTNEEGWIRLGQCYGTSENYGDLAELKDKGPLRFESMGTSTTLAAQKDMIALKVAKGEPLDRRNQKMRARLDAITHRIAQSVPDGHGGHVTVFAARTGFDLVKTHGDLLKMYGQMDNQRQLLGELLRRFSAELFWRNFDGKNEGGGFMHGDLHGGNLLVNDNTMTVIDFGNSFRFTVAERRQLVGFVSACGFAKAELALEQIDPKMSRRKDYPQILADVERILAKGDANDIVARGMAVVQYLQKKDVKVPGPIINFTETVMRLAAAYDETNALLEDIGNTITDLKISPDADFKNDPYAEFAGILFTGNLDYAQAQELKGRIKDMISALRAMYDHPEKLSRETFEKNGLPLLAMLRGLDYHYVDEQNENTTVGAYVRNLEAKFRLLGPDAFTTKVNAEGKTVAADPRVTQLLLSFCEVAVIAASEVSSSLTGDNLWQPKVPEGLNDCMSVGLRHLDKWVMAGIVGRINALGMAAGGDAVIATAERTVSLRRIAGDAQTQYQRRTGQISLPTRRFVGRMVRDHFIWSRGKPATIFKAKKWYADPESVTKVVDVLKLNLRKLRDGLAAAKIKDSEEVENYAFIAFALEHGLIHALQALAPENFQKLLGDVRDQEIVAKLRFLREDPAVVEAVQLGRCREAGTARVEYESMVTAYSYTKAYFKPLVKPIALAGEGLKTLVTTLEAQYTALDGNIEFDDAKDRTVTMDYALMRHWLDEGFLQQLHALDPKARQTVYDAFGKKSKLPKLLQRLMVYMD